MSKPVFVLVLVFAVLLLSGCGGGGGGGSDSNGGGGIIEQQTPVATDPIITNTVQTKVTAVCMNCHAGIQAPNMSSAAALKANANLALNMASTREMPPDDSGFPKLTDCQIAVFDEWVERGTPDNSNANVGSLPECD